MINKTNIQACSRCILDNNDYHDISFNHQGVCNICGTYDLLVKQIVRKGENGKKELDNLLKKIKENGQSKEYDCIIGLSGGVDSSYLCYLAFKWNLRPLVVHVDNGWNSELAVFNIENIVKKLGFDLYTYVIDWKDMKNMHLAFLKASVVDIELPFDNMFKATLFKVARKFQTKYILWGTNFLSEGYLPPNFHHHKLDTINIKNIYKIFSGEKIRDFPLIGEVKINYLTRLLGYKTIAPLDYIDYDKEQAKKTLNEEIGWVNYGDKHFENVFTRFYQGYILPVKFGVDKRKAHLSTLICSGQISREEALRIFHENKYHNSDLCKRDLEFVIKKLEITETEFIEILKNQPVSHLNYRSSVKLRKKIRDFVKTILKKK